MSKSWRTALAVGVARRSDRSHIRRRREVHHRRRHQERLDRAQRPEQSSEESAQGQSGPAAGPPGRPDRRAQRVRSSLSTTVRSQDFAADGSGLARGEVRCPAGMVATGGTVSPGLLFTITDLPSSDGAGWVGEAGGSTRATECGSR